MKTPFSQIASFTCDQANKEETRKSAELVIKEAKENGYKPTVQGIDLFLDNCLDQLPENATQYYRFAIANNLDLLN